MFCSVIVTYVFLKHLWKTKDFMIFDAKKHENCCTAVESVSIALVRLRHDAYVMPQLKLMS